MTGSLVTNSPPFGSLLVGAQMEQIEQSVPLDLTHRWEGWSALAVFVVAYALVMAEERLGLRKSKPVVLAAGIIWALVALAYVQAGETAYAAAAVRETFADFGELFFFCSRR